MKTGYLILETGEIFEGKLIGNESRSGEVVFNTSMTGYQEIISDPSYAGQIIAFTYPLIGNYGVNEEFDESKAFHVNGIVTSEIWMDPNSSMSSKSLLHIIEKHQIPCLTEVDTRQLVKTIRKKGTVKGVLSVNKSATIVSSNDSDIFQKVTTDKVITYENDGPHIMLLDFGYKKSIVSYLLQRNCKVTIVPYHYSLEKIQELIPDGVIISNGPGNPMDAKDELIKIRTIAETYPTLGICLGHQLIGLAFGAKTKKLYYGHRGGNHPVKDLESGKVFVTSQNHGYVVDDVTVDETEFIISFRNVNDGTVEGLHHRTKPIRSVQFHPEGHPGPRDAEYIFDQFIQHVVIQGY